MTRTLISLFSCTMLLGLPTVRGQSISSDVMNNSGGYGVISGKTYEWSIGEMVVTTETSSSIIITQGVLQPLDAPNAIADVKLLSQFDVFPNPSSSIVNISLNAPADGTLAYRLMDVTGRLVLENTSDVKPGTTVKQMDIKHLACATYMLHVSYTTSGIPTTKTYKIQKLD